MIVDPDFVDHWRTRMLVGLLGKDEMAPIYVLRLWAHCQNRRKWVFDLPVAGLQGICHHAGDAHELESAMEQSGFIKRSGGEIEVIGWADYNASLIAAWSNGSKGGRPRKQRNEDSSETHGIPMGIPQETHGVTDKIREDKNIKEKSKTNTRAPRFDAQAHLESLGVQPEVARDWLTLRKGKKLAPTETAFAGVQREAEKASMSMNDALLTCCSRGWGGFDASWLVNKGNSQAPPRGDSKKFDPVAYVNRNRPEASHDGVIDIEAERVA